MNGAGPQPGPAAANGDAVTLEQWLADAEQLLRRREADPQARVTVVVPTATAIDHPHLKSLRAVDKVVICIESFTDGRVFGLARLLRQRFRFAGELEVSGDYLPDQMSFLRRCGVDSFAGDPGRPAAAGYYSGHYQPAARPEGQSDIRGWRLNQAGTEAIIGKGKEL